MARTRTEPQERATETLQIESGAQPEYPDSSHDRTDSPELIARRAYERFRMRGSEHGHDQDDWLEAEREVREVNQRWQE